MVGPPAFGLMVELAVPQFFVVFSFLFFSPQAVSNFITIFQMIVQSLYILMFCIQDQALRMCYPFS
jgi:hypothetical protein